MKQDKINTADSAFIFLIILLISKNRWSGWSGRKRCSCLAWSLLYRAVLGGTELYSAVLGFTKVYWTGLGCTARYWAVVGCSGRCWAVLGGTGLKRIVRAVLGCTELY